MERDHAMAAARAALSRLRCVVLIACSGRKQLGGAPRLDPAPHGLLDQLRSADRNAVLSTRQRLATLAHAQPDAELGGSSTQGRYRPAFERYRGRVYQPVDHHLWPREGNLRVVIVSALYGLLFAWEPIQDYELTMTSKAGHRERVAACWKQAGLGTAFARWAAQQQVQCVIDLLSGHYRAALRNLDVLRQGGIQRIPFDYPGRFQASNLDRGFDLKELLALDASSIP